MSRSIDRTFAFARPGLVPGEAVPIATLELASPAGLAWREKLWLRRSNGRDMLWAAVAEAPHRAIPVSSAEAEGTPEESGFRLLAVYLAETRAEVVEAQPGSDLICAERLAAIVALRRTGWVRH